MTDKAQGGLLLGLSSLLGTDVPLNADGSATIAVDAIAGATSLAASAGSASISVSAAAQAGSIISASGGASVVVDASADVEDSGAIIIPVEPVLVGGRVGAVPANVQNYIPLELRKKKRRKPKLISVAAEQKPAAETPVSYLTPDIRPLLRAAPPAANDDEEALALILALAA